MTPHSYFQSFFYTIPASGTAQGGLALFETASKRTYGNVKINCYKQKKTQAQYKRIGSNIE